MSKALSIALVVVIALLSASIARAEDGAGPVSPAQRIAEQERGRHADPRLFGPAAPSPILVAGSPDGFDVRDAAVGGGAGFALALLATAGVAFGVSRRTGAGVSGA